MNTAADMGLCIKPKETIEGKTIQHCARDPDSGEINMTFTDGTAVILEVDCFRYVTMKPAQPITKAYDGS